MSQTVGPSARGEYLFTSPNPKFQKIVEKKPKHASVSNDGSAFPKVSLSLESFYDVKHLLGEYCL
jgi:hypothetical protein